jgi:biopolymer transport protein ExbB
MNGIILATALLATAQQPAAQEAGDTAPTRDFDDTLQDAYRKEFAFLAGQKRELQTRLDNLNRRITNEQAQLQGEISRLETRILGIDSTIQDVSSKVNEADREAQTSSDEKQLIEATLDQARVGLKDYDVSFPAYEGEEPSPEYIASVFDAAAKLLRRLSSVRKEDGSEFFLANGTKVKGSVIHVGRIAAFGVSDDGAGALAPAGGGKLKVWRESDGTSAQALAGGQNPDALSVFLYESLDGRVDEEAEETIYKHINDGGLIAWVIVGLGVFGVLLAILRALLLSSASGGSKKVEDALSGLVRAGKYGEAADRARQLKGSAARVATSVFDSLKEGQGRADEAINEGMLGESRNIQRFGTVILVIAAVSPLLGLLGTVTGMISTFDVITKFGTGDPKLLSGGISTALITTELGLVVAIPTLLLGNLLKAWADSIESQAEQTSLRLVTMAPDFEPNEPEEPPTMAMAGPPPVPQS